MNLRYAGGLVTAVVLAALSVLLLAVLLPGLSLPANADTEDDSVLVYCLSPAQRTGLLDAAVALGYARRDNAGGYLAQDGGKLDPVSWRRNHSADFTRTCRALSAAQRPPGRSVFATALPFLTGLTGALVAFIAATWRDRIARGRTLADDLRSAFGGFHQAARAHLQSWSPGHSDSQALVERRGALLIQVARAKAAHRRWTTVHRVASELASEKRDWTSEDKPDKPEVTAWLNNMQDTVFRIAHALEQPMRPHPDLRAKPTDGQS